jgi:hypothetical protein
MVVVRLYIHTGMYKQTEVALVLNQELDNIAAFYIDTVGNTATANTFGNMSIYFPNYTSSNFKSFSVDAVTENNGTAAFIDMGAHLFSDTNAINRITFISAGLFLEHSTAYLYGISNA